MLMSVRSPKPMIIEFHKDILLVICPETSSLTFSLALFCFDIISVILARLFAITSISDLTYSLNSSSPDFLSLIYSYDLLFISFGYSALNKASLFPTTGVLASAKLIGFNLAADWGLFSRVTCDSFFGETARAFPTGARTVIAVDFCSSFCSS